MAARGHATLNEYLAHVRGDSAAYREFLSAITIHLTQWFREPVHFEQLLNRARDAFRANRKFRLWSAACSSGEEVYSAALVLEQAAREAGGGDWLILGTDIDPLSVETASRALYPTTAVAAIPERFRASLLQGSGPSEGRMTLARSLRERCQFRTLSLADPASWRFTSPFDSAWDMIWARNVLIYFDLAKQRTLVEALLSKLGPEGTLVLGLSDIRPSPSLARCLGNSIYVPAPDDARPAAQASRSRSKPRLLLVDDSETLRKTLAKRLAERFEVIACDSAAQASARTAEQGFAIITLDLNMPGQNGADWLREFRKRDTTTPVVILSESSPQDAARIFGALESGAQEYIVKSRLHADGSAVLDLLEAIARADRAADGSLRWRLAPLPKKKIVPEAILIGASTGGPEALAKLLGALTKPCPAVLVVQHIHTDFSAAFAARLARIAGLRLCDPREGGALEANTLTLSTSDAHLTVKRRGEVAYLSVEQSPPEEGHRPSVNRLFETAAAIDLKCVAVVLTGMGCDGTRGMEALAQSGQSLRFAQDAASSVVFGMPRQALETGHLHGFGNLSWIQERLEDICRRAVTRSYAA